MRGSQKLFKPFFAEVTEAIKPGRGRSETLINKRDRKLILRYYYYTSICRLKYEETIKQLINEFDLAERTITDRLQLNNDQINEVMKQKPTPQKLKIEIPHFKW
jgi:hypothetical protein